MIADLEQIYHLAVDRIAPKNCQGVSKVKHFDIRVVFEIRIENFPYEASPCVLFEVSQPNLIL